MSIPMVFLDMDGVCCDFVGSVFSLMGETYPPIEMVKGDYNFLYNHFGPHSKVRVHSAIEFAGQGFWERMKEYPWCGELVSYCFELCGPGGLFFLSEPYNPASAAGKVEWLRRKIGTPLNQNYILTGYKSLLAGPGKILIDDKDSNISAWEAAGGIGILVNRPWNSGYALIEQTVGEIEHEIEERLGELDDDIFL